jgi:hypothetical protein
VTQTLVFPSQQEPLQKPALPAGQQTCVSVSGSKELAAHTGNDLKLVFDTLAAAVEAEGVHVLACKRATEVHGV